MSLNIHGPGMLWVQSRIAPESTNVLKESTFLQWYDEEHIPEVVSTTGIKDGFRYVDAHKSIPSEDSANSKPFLALYPMSDLAFTLGDEFRKISVTSDKLPGSGMIYDMAEFDISYMGLLGMIGNHSGMLKGFCSHSCWQISLMGSQRKPVRSCHVVSGQLLSSKNMQYPISWRSRLPKSRKWADI